MEASVVIATHNQKERLRLVLAGLRVQTFPRDRFEVLVVDDGSTDGTAEMVQGIGLGNLRLVCLHPNVGRCAARNRGIEQAQGELVVFLDGDALPHPQLIESYWSAYGEFGPEALLRGHHLSLPYLEHFQDPQTGALEEPPRRHSLTRVLLEQMQGSSLREWLVTEEMIREDFAAIDRGAVEGGYPEAGVRAMEQHLRETLQSFPHCRAGWIGFVPHNAAVPRARLMAAQGFDERISFSEGMELAYRLYQQGMHTRWVAYARSYHLYHYHDFSDPRQSRVRFKALERMAERFAEPRIFLVPFLHAHFWHREMFPENAIITGLREFERLFGEISADQLREYLLVLHTLESSRVVETLLGESRPMANFDLPLLGSRRLRLSGRLAGLAHGRG
jgi:glycosyltransferase involved in cell wall biosynthesis